MSGVGIGRNNNNMGYICKHKKFIYSFFSLQRFHFYEYIIHVKYTRVLVFACSVFARSLAPIWARNTELFHTGNVYNLLFSLRCNQNYSLTNNFLLSINCKVFPSIDKDHMRIPPFNPCRSLSNNSFFRTLQYSDHQCVILRPTIWYQCCLLRIEMNQKCWMKIVGNPRNPLSLKPK